MTGGSNYNEESLLYKIDDFYQTFEVFDHQSMRRWAYRAYLSILGLLFLLSLIYTLINIMIFREYILWLAITIFFELTYLKVNANYLKFISDEKLKILRISFACSYDDLSDIKSLWLRNNFSMERLNVIQLLRDINYLIDLTQRFKLNRSEFNHSLFSFIYNGEAKNRILALIGVLITVISLSLTQLLIVSHPPDFHLVSEFLFSSTYLIALVVTFALLGALLWFLRSSKQDIYRLIEKFLNRRASSKKYTTPTLTQYKAKFLVEYLIQIAPAQSRTNN